MHSSNITLNGVPTSCVSSTGADIDIVRNSEASSNEVVRKRLNVRFIQIMSVGISSVATMLTMNAVVTFDIHKFGDENTKPRSSSIISNCALLKATIAVNTTNTDMMAHIGDECKNRVMLAAFIYREFLIS
jgi:hypothetical protein